MKKWTLNSWKKFPAKHMPKYPDQKELDLVLGNLFTTVAILKDATGPISARTIFITSSIISECSVLVPSFKTIRPNGIWPFNVLLRYF